MANVHFNIYSIRYLSSIDLYSFFKKIYDYLSSAPWFLPGIGKATALRLAQAGAIVIATDISEEALKSLDAIKGNKST